MFNIYKNFNARLNKDTNSDSNSKINPLTKKWKGKCHSFVVIDFETTGLGAESSEIIEVCAVKVVDKQIVDCYQSLVKPKYKIPIAITNINGITNEMVKSAPIISEVMPKLLAFIGDSIIVAHNASFDMKFLKHNATKCGCDVRNPYIDTLSVSRSAFPALENHKLKTVAYHVGVRGSHWHRAEADAMAAAHILLKCIETQESPTEAI